MKKWFVFGFILLSFLGAKVGLADVDYRIPSYDGQLYLFDDNTARFEQKVTYQFDSSYNGQYITIGKVGNLPKDFQINPEPHIDIFKNDEKVDFKKEIEDLGDGYRLKLYNSGHSGDRVEVKVFWQLKNLMTLYHDVAEINWLPISDWNQTIEKVTFSVKTPMAVPDARLWAHRGYYEKEPEVTRKDAILRQEKKIAQTRNFRQVFFGKMLPLASLVFMLLQLMAYVKAKRAFSRFSQQNKKDHLYEAPEELSPLVLTQNIYGKSFKEMVDSGDAQLINSGITFEQMIQATLLDLIDRKLLGLSKEEGKLQIENLSKEALNKEEALFTEMAFGEKTKVDIERLFAHYQYDKQQIKVLKKKYHGKQLEEMVHQSSEAVLAQIKQKSQAITEAVAETIAQLGLKSPYRPLSHRERIGVRSSQWMGGTGLILLLIVMVFLFIQGSQLAPIYLGLFALEALILLYTAFHLETYMLSGVETQEGAYRVHQWQSFRNIIRDINKFDDVEIEGLVVWNRILVYATLFGYAKKVENYLKVHRIALPEAYHVLNSGNLSYLLYNTTPHFVSTLSSATEASHFTVPSGGSGMSGGGFSGGGGGGGGAF